MKIKTVPALLALGLLTSLIFNQFIKNTIDLKTNSQANLPKIKEAATQSLPHPQLPKASAEIKVKSLPPAPVLPMQLGSHQKVNPRYTQKPVDMTVEFEMTNGMAVTFGDTILGKPGSDFSGKKGVTEIRHPQYWNNGIIPYSINSNILFPEKVKQALEYFNQHTSVRFVPYEGQADAIVFERGEEHCYSYLGKTGGLQPIFLSDRCGTPQITHELMHALGFVHEQSRTDRDLFLEILWPNIEEKYHPQFAMVPEPLMQSYFDSPFDPKSIMIYEPHAFAVKPTLETMKMKSSTPIEPSEGTLSPSDVERVNRLYKN